MTQGLAPSCSMQVQQLLLTRPVWSCRGAAGFPGLAKLAGSQSQQKLKLNCFECLAEDPTPLCRRLHPCGRISKRGESNSTPRASRREPAEDPNTTKPPGHRPQPLRPARLGGAGLRRAPRNLTGPTEPTEPGVGARLSGSRLVLERGGSTFERRPLRDELREYPWRLRGTKSWIQNAKF